MCLAIPGKIVGLDDQNGLRMAKVDYGGITRNVCMAYIPEASLGEYVMVHVGFAISRVDEAEAARAYAFLAEMGQLDEIETPESESITTTERDT